MAEQNAWARDTAVALLAPLGQRWAHTRGVVERARSFAVVLRDEFEALVAAHHSGARAEAEERGLLDQLEAFAEERSLVADVLCYCDLTTDAAGAQTTVSARLADIVARYCDGDPVGRAISRSGGELLDRSRAVERALRSRSRG